VKKSVEESENEVTVVVDPERWSLDAVRMAAHVVADRAYAHLAEEAGTLVVTLHAKERADKSSLQALAELFDREVQNQALRLKLERGNRETMEYVVSRALVPANKSAGPEAGPEAELSEDQKSEIDRLIAEAEEEIAELKQEKSGADPLGITKTWEEQNQKGERD
jgi:His-Xaa-Ser system protein HxsD